MIKIKKKKQVGEMGMKMVVVGERSSYIRVIKTGSVLREDEL